MKIIKATKQRICNFFGKKIMFSDLSKRDYIYLYAGDVPEMVEYDKCIGLSINQSNKNHIKHDVINKFPIEDNSVDIFQSEDVFEHIEFEKLSAVINEIYRILKPGGLFRMSLPDYRCDILNQRTLKGRDGSFLFDPEGGGKFVNGKVIKGGHLWFPTYEIVKDLLEKTSFENVKFLHYYNESGEAITHKIDYSIGYIKRTPDNDPRVKSPYRPLSIVVDCVK